MKLSAEAALVVVLSHSLVLFVFSSTTLSNLFQSLGLPGIMLVPVSSSQAIVGAIVGIGLLKGGRGIQYGVLGKISIGWIATPIIAGITTFVSLFFMNNVFKMVVVQNENNVITNKLNDVIIHPQTNTSVNLYQPLLFLIIIVLVIALVVMLVNLIRTSSQTKEDASSERLLKYESQEKMLNAELQKVNTENAKLEKQIEFKRKEQMVIALSIIQKNQFLEKLKIKIDKIISKPEVKAEELITLKRLIIDNLSIDKEREKFNFYVNELNADFYLRLANRFPDLSENEQRLAALIRLNLSSKEIASILNISTKSVEVNRHRLRKKMRLKREENLTEIVSKL
jgi:DNA-binding CsgD family transcriptional regulator